MTKIIPQRANVTHRAEGASLLPATKTSYHRLLFCFYCLLIFLLLYKQKNFLKMFVFCFTKPFLYGIIHS